LSPAGDLLDARAYSQSREPENATVALMQTPVQVLLVGAQGNLGRAIVAAAPPGSVIRRVVRRPEPGADPEQTVVVQRYADLPASAFQGIDVVINAVGRIVGPDDTAFEAANVTVPTALASQARAAGVGGMVHVSSLSVYGNTPWMGRDTPLAPTSPYGRSKARADVKLEALSAPDFPIALLRIPTLYGQDTRNKIARLLALLLRLGGFLTIAPEPQRSVLHIDQAAAAVWALASRRWAGPSLVGDPAPFSLSVAAQAINRTLNRRIPLLTVPSATLAPLAFVAKGTYRSLFTSSLIDPQSNAFDQLTLATDLPGGLARQLHLLKHKER
jgi:nucleoside-diphosphate-sugar epimerase